MDRQSSCEHATQECVHITAKLCQFERGQVRLWLDANKQLNHAVDSRANNLFPGILDCYNLARALCNPPAPLAGHQAVKHMFLWIIGYMDYGLLTMDYYGLDCVLWTKDYGLRTVEYGPWTMDPFGLR